MKKLLTLLMAAALVLNIAAIPAVAAGSTVFETDFQSYQPDEVIFSKGQNVSIVEDELNPKDKVVAIGHTGVENPDDSDPTYAVMEVNIPEQTSTFTLEADFMPTTASTWIQMFHNNSWPYGPGILISGNGIAAYNGASLASVEGTSLKQNDWIRVSIEVNPSARKYKLFLDGVQAFENDFRSTTMSAVNRIKFAHNVNGATSYVDNIIVYSGSYSAVASKKVNLHAFDPMSAPYTKADESRYELFPAAVMAEYYVDPKAADGGTGTKQAPYNSIEKAIKAVRKANDKMTGDIIVHIKDGEYYIDETIMMTEDDAGTNGFSIIYRGETPGGAVLSGAKKLTGWKKHSDNIWKVPLEDTAYTLYQDDRRSIKARYPNREFDKEFATYAGGYLVATGTTSAWISSDKLQYKKDDLKHISFSDITDANLCAWPWNERDWSRYTMDIEKVDKGTGVIDCTFEAPSLGLGTRYYIEGMLELLDAEGEFHYDSDEKMLYYMPYGGKDPNSECSVYAPKEVELINITGRTLTPVEDIVFENLAFEKTNFLSSFASWQSVYEGNDMGAVTLDTANDVKFLSCRFKNTGLSGLYIKGNSNYNYVYNCLFENMGLAGVIPRR